MLADRLNRRPQRRTAQPRFRGQFEPLESRTVLSATIGVMTFDTDANIVTIAVLQVPTGPPVRPAMAAFADAPSYAGGPAHAIWRQEGDGRISQQKIMGVSGSAGGDFFQDFESLGNSTRDRNQPLKSHAATEPDPSTGIPDLRVDPDPGGGFVNLALNRIQYTRAVSDAALSYVPMSSVLSAPTSELSQRSVPATTDASFDKHTTNSLLLGTADNLADGDSPDDRLGDDDALDDEESATDAGDSFAAEEVAASLDALRRERLAIDAVFSELRDVSLKEHDEPPTTRSDEQVHSEVSRHAAKDFVSTDATADLRESIPADGGMVLLAPAGDPNSSAYDLADVFFSRLGGDAHAPLAVEASLGMYQAIDVGTLPAASRASLPVAQPTQTGGPSVSAENAPAKQSEQPT